MTLARLRGWIRCHPTAVTVIGSLVVAAALVIGLTATAAVGALCFASWALVDRLRGSRAPALAAAAS